MISSDLHILVTGAHGLVGSAVTDRLRAIYGVANVFPLTRKDADLRDLDETTKVFRYLKPDLVVHAAATVYGLGGNMANQAKSIFDNTLINTNVVDASRSVGVKKIIAMGTNAVYPWPPQLPYREETIFNGRPHDGESGYGHAKRHLLAMLEAYKSSYGLDYCYLVSGNLYGPRDTFNVETGHVLPSLVKKFYDASQDPGKMVVVWGDGSQSRDFLYVEDLARIIRYSLVSPFMVGAVNTGYGKSHNLIEVCNELTKLSGVGYDRVFFDTSRPVGRPDCMSDLSKLRAVGFDPQFTLAHGLALTYKWYHDKRQQSCADYG